MRGESPIVYPYIPNSTPEAKKRMLEEIGATSLEDLYGDIPDKLRFKGMMNLPRPFLSEYELKRHVDDILFKNTSCDEYLSFLGGGCYRHYVPSVCDEVNRRAEFLTAYAGSAYEDHGRYQALFESCSLIGELLNMDVVSIPTYDGFQAAATAIRMACRITDRRHVLVAKTINPDMLSKIRDYCKPELDIEVVGSDPRTGQVDIPTLEASLSVKTAAVFFENPSYLGFIEAHGAEITRLAHDRGALSVVEVDPISLGVLNPPVEYGADIVCGDIQSLGMHMQFGGGQAGFIATRDEPNYVMEYPSRIFGLTPTSVPGEYGFGDVAYERTSFAHREQGKEWTGTATALLGITAGVYLALMGPKGMLEIGESIMARAHYAMRSLSTLKGVRAPYLNSTPFKEFVVDFGGTGKTVAEINRGLVSKGIFGGHDLSQHFPEFGQSALYCVTEVHTKADIDRLVAALREVVE